MQIIPYLLCMLICPIGMGLMMWMGMRPQKEKQMMPPATSSISEVVPHFPQENGRQSGPSPLKVIADCAKMCLNWKILGGLALVGLAIGIIAPQWVWVTLPFLLIAVCPLSMLIMIFSMRHMHFSQRQKQCQGECMMCRMQQLPVQNGQQIEYMHNSQSK